MTAQSQEDNTKNARISDDCSDNLTLACLQKDTFLHFWCNANCGLTKEQAYREVVESLLEFNTDLYSSKTTVKLRVKDSNLVKSLSMFVKDLSLAETGSIQISLAEKDMPGLMAIRNLKLW